MNAIRTSFLMGLLVAGLNAAEEKPFMSFFNAPAQPLPLEEHRSDQSAAMQTKVGYNIYLTELNLAHEYWEIPGIKHDLPRLSAWIGSDGLQFALQHFGNDSKRE